MSSLNRRQFLGRSAAAFASVRIVPRHLLGGAGFTPPSEKVHVAGIGVGGQGGGDLRAVARAGGQIVALCDVDRKRAARSFKRFPEARRYSDFREMLAVHEDLDAVVVATPDHTHAVATLAAIERGKHVYVEKPLAHSIEEVRKMVAAARAAGVATQMGNQGHAAGTMRQLKEWLDAGAIGTVREVQAWTPHAVWPQGIDRPQETPPVPESLSWDLWLGPAPARPYHPAYVPALWRGWWDFGTGALGDMGCHILDPLFYALEPGPPASVEACGSMFVRGPGLNWNKTINRESYPRASIVRYRFPARAGRPPLKLTWYDGGLMPERPAELEEGAAMGNRFGGILFIGDRGKILAGSHGAGGLRILPEARARSFEKPAETLPRSIGHHAEWLAACQGGAAAGSCFDYAGPLTETVLLGNVALLAGRRILWDAEAMRITNASEANALLRREYREGWKL